MSAYRYQNLWHGCTGLWCPNQGHSGGTLIDYSPFRNHGTLTNMDPATDWATGKGGWALDLDGSNDYVDCGRAGNFTGAFALSVWFYHRGASQPVLIYKGDYSVSGYYLQIGRTSANDLGFVTNQSGAFQGTSTAGGYITTNTWYHLVVNFQAPTARMFLNGVEVSYASSGTHIQPADSSSNFRIGQYSSAYALNGLVAEVGIYNRQLGQSEIQTLAQRPGIAFERKRRMPAARGASVTAKIPNFVHHYKMQGIM